jgi:Lrp/AsnC family leucine-responsive transcriptional regulator
MDVLDKKILNILQEDGRISIKKMSQQFFITAPAVSQRLRNLEESGYIKDYHAQLDFHKVDLQIKAYIQLSLEPQQKSDFYPYIETVPNILECDCITGPFSILLKVMFENTNALDSFITELQRYGRTNTQIVFSTPIAHRGYLFPDC